MRADNGMGYGDPSDSGILVTRAQRVRLTRPGTPSQISKALPNTCVQPLKHEHEIMQIFVFEDISLC
jgi:hypothetical protein